MLQTAAVLAGFPQRESSVQRRKNATGDYGIRQREYETVYDATHPRILGYSLRRAASPEDAADVVAEAS